MKLVETLSVRSDSFVNDSRLGHGRIPVTGIFHGQFIELQTFQSELLLTRAKCQTGTIWPNGFTNASEYIHLDQDQTFQGFLVSKVTG
jgi:hypothetical protein